MIAPARPPGDRSDSGVPRPPESGPSGSPEMPGGVPDLIPARMLNEVVYCPRLFYLEFVQAQFADSADTIEGRTLHRRVDRETGDLPEPAPAADQHGSPTVAQRHPAAPQQTLVDGPPPPAEQPAEPQVARSVYLSAPEVGLIARIDLLEHDGPLATPVDYKRGAVPDHLPHRAWPPDRVQIAAQALILRENGYACDHGVIYYAASKTRVSVPIDDNLIAQTLRARDDARRLARAGEIPPPLADSPKCPACSLVGICLPDEIIALRDLEAGRQPAEVRRLLPARDDPQPVYVQAYSGSVGKTGEQIYITAKDRPRQTVRLLDVSQLCLFGNIQVSTQAIRQLVTAGIPICYFSFGGYFQAITTGLTHKNVELRIRQFQAAHTPEQSLAFARNFILGKVRNCRTMLRRNCATRPRDALRDLNDLRKRIQQADNPATLLGLEGNAAKLYFRHFPDMFKTDPTGTLPFDFSSRNRRPPRDPVNALLSFAYSLLAKELTVTTMRVGFDPFLGFYHRPKYGRPALALDLAEEFRPLVADSAVIQVINTGEIKPTDFVQRGPACNLKPNARKTFIAAFERRLDGLVRHPIFGYTISYRRVLEVQARLLAACLAGEFPEYVPFMTR